MKFYYVYVLRSFKDKKFYVGKTEDLVERFKSHQKGEVKSTSSRKPFELIFYEAFKNKMDADKQEKFFKTGYGREVLKGKLNNFLQDLERCRSG